MRTFTAASIQLHSSMSLSKQANDITDMEWTLGGQEVYITKLF